MKTNNVRKRVDAASTLDRIDRKILTELVADATQSYAELGKRAGLSAPAVHERVKRMRASGVIRATSALLDGRKIGKPLLVFVHVATNNWGHSQALEELARLPEFEEMHSVTGGTSIILKVRLADSDALESLLRQIHSFESVVATETFVSLSTYVERPPQPGITEAWPELPLPTS